MTHTSMPMSLCTSIEDSLYVRLTKSGARERTTYRHTTFQDVQRSSVSSSAAPLPGMCGSSAPDLGLGHNGQPPRREAENRYPRGFILSSTLHVTISARAENASGGLASVLAREAAPSIAGPAVGGVLASGFTATPYGAKVSPDRPCSSL